MYMNILPLCSKHAWCQRRTAEGIKVPGTGVTDGGEPLTLWVLGIKQKTSAKQHVLLATEPSLHLHSLVYFFIEL